MKCTILLEISSEDLEKNPQIIEELGKAFNSVIRRASGDEPTKSNNGNATQQPRKTEKPAAPPFPLSDRSVRINGEPVGAEPLANGKEVAAYIGASVGYVRFLVMKKKIPFFKIGRFVKFRFSEIDAWIAEKGADRRKKPGRKPASGKKPGPEEIK